MSLNKSTLWRILSNSMSLPVTSVKLIQWESSIFGGLIQSRRHLVRIWKKNNHLKWCEFGQKRCEFGQWKGARLDKKFKTKKRCEFGQKRCEFGSQPLFSTLQTLSRLTLISTHTDRMHTLPNWIWYPSRCKASITRH